MTLGGHDKGVRTYDLLDQIITILGTTKTSFWPFLEPDGAIVGTYKGNAAPGVATDSGVDGLQVHRHAGSVHSVHFDSSDNQHILVPDEANLSILAASGVPISIGCWFYAEAGSSTLISKYDTNDKREYKLTLNADPDIVFEIYDESEDDTFVTTIDTALNLEQWYSVVVTWSGATPSQADYAVYIDGSAVAETGSAVGAAFSAVEDLTGDFAIGGDLATGSVANNFDGWIALPFVTGGLLTAANADALYRIGKTLLGV